MANELLNVQGLETQFKTPEGIVHAVNGVSFTLNEGETMGVVGESGCGKSVTMLSCLRLIPQPPGKIVAGKALFKGQDLLAMSSEDIRHVRGAQIAMVFQDPMTSLNPVMTIGKQMEEPLKLHLGFTPQQARSRSIELLEQVGIPRAADRLKDYPHQYSGGMRQRVMIAMALACAPQILIADEPTTALDVTIQAQIVELVIRLREELGMAIIWITHDLGVVASIAHRVAVMYGGFIIEEAQIRDLYANPRHPYTIGLLGSLPQIQEQGRKRLYSIEGMPPMLYQKPHSCPFSPRCRWVTDRCRMENPLLEPVGENHRVACWVDTTTGRER
ncbi:MAG: ABC transporter ATP-binding protein [Anaerolineaceae bacterium]|nr:ABC transporter ATP-binding protein [Anaerolineaceae bacterium]HNX46417.1 ABC transporter ATP-binding protein [Anaerolineaceae bacterium]HPT23629.1 ABC transporter ATP-binding protein [Anaerolineaceae bacterium]